MFKISKNKNPNYTNYNPNYTNYNCCLLAKCIIKVSPYLFVFIFRIENIRLVLKLYLPLSMCAGSRLASLCWSLSTICLNRLLHNSSRLWKSVFKPASSRALLCICIVNLVNKSLPQGRCPFPPQTKLSLTL